MSDEATNEVAEVSEDNGIITIPPEAKTASMAGFAIEAVTQEQAWSLCQNLAKSDMTPKALQGKPESIYSIGCMGARLGLDIFTAMQGIASVNGKPTIYGDLLLAICKRHPEFEDTQESYEGSLEDGSYAAVCTVKRQGQSAHTERFSMADAKLAGLWGKQGPWKQFPARMMMWRARSYAYRTVFADILLGLHTHQEMMDVREVKAEVRSASSLEEVANG
jgi:hypothetical protein